MEPIQDYAVIGDCRSAALVSRRGSIDWLCWPRFDSPSIFGTLLDDAAGRWSIRPTGLFRCGRRYLDATNVLETHFHTDTGTVVLTDFMPVASEEEKRHLLVPDHEILRIVECQQGEVELEMVFDPCPGYGSEQPRLRRLGQLGLRCEIGGGLLTLRTDLPIQVGSDDCVRSRSVLRAGDTYHLSLTFAEEWPAILPPVGAWSREAFLRSVAWWNRWSSQLTYDGPARDAVLRSALVLKLLAYAPSGALIAAPTTSLPEQLHGDLNWDYRFCWLRDASLTVRALFGLGYPEEAEAFMSWLLHSTRLTQPELRVLYDLHGNQPQPERVLQHLAGHRGSRPVRVGNAATGQLQLDVYGEVIDAAAQVIRHGETFSRETRRMLCAFGEYVCKNWNQPDEGIWEPRTGKDHNTHSRVLCWTALDRLLELHAKGHLPGAPVEKFEREREFIRHEVELRAWNSRLQSYVSRLDGDGLDASLLLLAWYGFEKASSERMRQTYVRIREQLGAGNGLLYRYRTKDSPGEGAFGICSFWAAEFLALGGGTAEEAQSTLERLCGYANDVGLYAEEIDPETGGALGNFPQAFTHIGLINAALSLCRRLRSTEPLVRPSEEIAPQGAPL